MSQSQRRGFTVVELMMVIIIIALLAALLMNAVQSSREMGRRTQCMNKMRQAGMAAIDFESAHSGYPGWLHPVFGAPPPPPQQPRRGVNSWIYQLLPALGHSDLTEKDPSGQPPQAVDRKLNAVLNDLLVCPSDTEKMSSRNPLTSIVCNAGRYDADGGAPWPPPQGTPADWRSNAVFMNRNDRDANGNAVKVDVTDASFISKGDGLATTLLLSENLDAGTWSNPNPIPPDETVNCLVFWPPDSQGNPPHEVCRINGPKTIGATNYYAARPSSFHPGGVNMFFCGGHGRFVSANMDYRVYCAIMTPRGANAMEPGSSPPQASVPQITNQPKITEDDFQ